MEILLQRSYNCKTYCIGHLYVDGKYICDTIEDIDRGLNQSMTLEEIKKKKVYKETAIPAGRYKVTTDVVSPSFSLKPYYRNFCGGRLPRLLNVPGYEGILMHCLTPDMEILTENGWKNYEQFKEEPEKNCYSYNTETGNVELVPIEKFIEQDYNGKIYSCKGRVCYSVTDKHRMWVEVRRRDNSRVFEWRTADNTPTAAKFITAGHKEGGWELSEQQKLLYRIIIATQADGYILNWSKTASQVRFHFKKERKIQRLMDYLDTLGDKYKINYNSDGSTSISLSAQLSEYITEVMNPTRNVYKTKELPFELLSLKEEDMRDLIMEYLFWDGRWENYIKNNNNKIICSVNKRTIDILQTMAFMCGMRTARKITIRNGKWENVMSLYLFDEQELTMPSPESYSVDDYSGKVWCVSNKNHTIIVRKNGRTCVLGNCGSNQNSSAGCLIVGYNTIKGQVTDSQKAFEKLYNILRSSKNQIYIEIKRKYKV